MISLYQQNLHFKLLLCMYQGNLAEGLPIVITFSVAAAAAASTAAVTEAFTFGANTLLYDETRDCFILDFSVSQL